MSDAPLLHLPEPFTALWHAPAYAALDARARARYNLLSACLEAEGTVLFEELLGGALLPALARSARSAPARRRLERTLAEERAHTRMFRALNRARCPELYEAHDWRFIRPGVALRALIAYAASRPESHPEVLWLMLMMEERSRRVAALTLAEPDRYAPEAVAVQRAHLRDETGHLRHDEALLREHWDGAPPALRRRGAVRLGRLVRALLLTPRRAGARLVARLAAERPEYAARLPEWRAALAGLGGSASYREWHFGPATLPRTRALMAERPEFAAVGAPFASDGAREAAA